MKKKTIEQVAEMSGTELSIYLLTLTPAERVEINNDELLKARGAAILQKLVANTNAQLTARVKPS